MNRKKKSLLTVAFIAGVTSRIKWSFSEGYISVSEFLSGPEGYSGQNIMPDEL